MPRATGSRGPSFGRSEPGIAMDLLPPDPASKPAAPAARAAAPSAPLKLRLLHVEDNPADVELIRQNLRRGGIDVEVHVVESTRECEAVMDREKFDLVISDFNLPQGDGMEVLACVRRKNTTIPFILVSGSLG